jgi:hypothetical protein
MSYSSESWTIRTDERRLILGEITFTEGAVGYSLQTVK